MRRMQTVAPPSAPTAATALGLSGQGRIFQSIQSDVTVPLLASAITGAGIASLVILISACVAYTRRVPFVDLAIPLLIGWIGIALVIMLAAWFWERHQIKKTWWRAEERDQIDYDGDGQVGRPGPDAIQVRSWRDDVPKQTAEELRQQRFEMFIAALYQAGKTDTETIRSLPAKFSEPERAKYIKALRDARLMEAEHSGKSAGWTFVPPDAQICVKLARQRVIWMDRSSSSSSSRPE